MKLLWTMMTTTKYLDIVLETMTNKISNSNKSNIHIHIGDKSKKGEGIVDRRHPEDMAVLM